MKKILTFLAIGLILISCEKTNDNPEPLQTDFKTQILDGYLVKISNDNWTTYSNSDLGFTPYYFGNIDINSKNERFYTIINLQNDIRNE